ncbi:hypothetical protein H5410_057939 [Solanum commersonii]|uniref:Pectinesterase catalytic domain-containing protein n=1 Tax=Solanum commersonii TaxID=4109 RepID=A0A9J5WR73_SOLCO|nr:hypothetical protein H5410_057939 [Solanum commersonii]
MDTVIITGNRSFVNDNKIYNTAIVDQDITFRNNVGPIKHQVVALKIEADSTSFYRCHFDGYQDTLYLKRQYQFYPDCEIYGTINFICYDAISGVRRIFHKRCHILEDGLSELNWQINPLLAADHIIWSTRIEDWVLSRRVCDIGIRN